MEKNVKNLLRAGVFIMVAAFAFAFSKPQINNDRFGRDSGIWYDVTGISPGPSTYTCDSGGQGCLYDEPSTSGQLISSGSNQLFVKRGNLPPAM